MDETEGTRESGAESSQDESTREQGRRTRERFPTEFGRG